MSTECCGMRKDMWVLSLLRFSTSFIYFAEAIIVMPYLIHEVGFSDSAAGWTYGGWGLMISVFSVGLGPLIDYWGVRTCLMGGIFIYGVGLYMFLVMASETFWVYCSLFLIQPLGLGLSGPGISVAIKRCTLPENRDVMFAVFYSILNVGALFAFLTVDFVRLHASTLHPHQTILMICLVGTGATILITLLLPDNQALSSAQNENFWTLLKLSLNDRRLWLIFFFVVVLLPVRQIFRYNDALMPEYLTRAYGKNTPYGSISAINPALVIPFAAPVTWWLVKKNYHPYDVVCVGTFISAMSLFILCIKETIEVPIIYMLVFTVGEIIYSPRISAYCLELAPDGREATYSAIADIPTFASKLFAGGLAGMFLEKYMPKDHPENHNGPYMWFLLAMISFISPLLLLLVYPFYKNLEKGTQKEELLDDYQRSAGGQEEVEPLKKKVEVRIGVRRNNTSETEANTHSSETVSRELL